MKLERLNTRNSQSYFKEMAKCESRKGWKPMTTEKPDIRVFCYKCWMNYMNAGMHYLQIYTEFKDSCEICGRFNGYEYIEVKSKHK